MRKLGFCLSLLGLALLPANVSSLQVYPRIFTPNGDGRNDKVVVRIDNPALLPLRGEVFDINGSKVSDMLPGPVTDESLVWDGQRSNSVVPSGIYIYQVELDGKIFTGTVIVAK
jgi:gliding motility-associated-like protein